MSRSSTPLVLLLTLVCGAQLGYILARKGPSLSAQSAATVAPASAARPAPTPRAVSDEAVYTELRRQYDSFEHVNRTFEMVARAVSPAVVHIVAEKTGRIDETARVRHFEETGSGVIVRGDGTKNLYVLTNNHVVEGAAAAKISIFRQDGSVVHPKQVWLDAKADIAVLNLDRDDLPAARLGNSDDVTVGSWVLALGSPFGLTHSVSQGIISARGRHMDELQDVENQDFLQTDAAINPGNSGGPLVNMKGEVIGINNSIASNGGGNEGVGFSIPVNLARWIMTQLVSKGRVTRGALGIDLHPEFRPEDAIALGLDRPHGAWIDIVHRGSPAAAAGLKDGDVILRFRGEEIHDLNHLINMVSMAPIGQPADLVVWRERKNLAMRVTVGEREQTISQAAPPTFERLPKSRDGLIRRPDRPGTPSSPVGVLGAELQTLDDPVARQHNLPTTLKGVLVLNVAPTSPLVQDIKRLDVIYSINDREVGTAEEAAKLLGSFDRSRGLRIGFDRVVRGTVERRTVQVP